jgi:hypothetical protein
MNPEQPHTRLRSLERKVKELTEGLSLPKVARLLVETRLADHWVDLDDGIDGCRRRISQLKLAMAGSVALATSAIGVEYLNQLEPLVVQSFSSWTNFLLLAGLSGVVAASYGLRVANFTLWLHTKASHLGVATELLGLTTWSPMVKQYLCFAAELYHESRGLDVIISRQLKLQECRCVEAKVNIERDASRKLLGLLYEMEE